TSRCARHRLDRRAFRNHLLHLRHQHRHAQVLERPAVRIPAKLHPQIVHADDFPEALGPEKIRTSFIQGNNIVIGNLRQYPFLFAPDAGAHGPFIALVTLLKQRLPLRAAALGQRLRVMLHLQQVIAAFALVHDGVQRISLSALRVNTLKPGSVWHHSISLHRAKPLDWEPTRDTVRGYIMDGTPSHIKETAVRPLSSPSYSHSYSYSYSYSHEPRI